MKPSALIETIRSARALVFDFDGTLVDSTAIKWRAFDRCFAAFPEHGDQIRTYCRTHHHTPRWEKFRDVYEQVLGLPYTPEIEAKLLARFDEDTTEQIIAAREIPGVTRFLAAVTVGCTAAVLSSTPHATLLHILERRGWRRWFAWVRGAPTHKARWLVELKALQALTRQELVFFGDTAEDATAAQEAGCTFVAVGGSLDGIASHWLEDFTEVSLLMSRSKPPRLEACA